MANQAALALINLFVPVVHDIDGESWQPAPLSLEIKVTEIPVTRQMHRPPPPPRPSIPIPTMSKDVPEEETIVSTEIDLSARRINQIPQVAEADLLRALQTLPGILPVSDFSSALYVRGGTPDQNLSLIDGSDVYNPEHAFGLFSTFNTEAIKKVEISKGGFGADFGGRLSSILNVTNLDGNLKAFIDINSKNKLTFSGYGGDDVLKFVFLQVFRYGYLRALAHRAGGGYRRRGVQLSHRGYGLFSAIAA